MTNEELRDHFAGLAMQSFIKRMPLNYTNNDIERVSGIAYLTADTMMEEREASLFPELPEEE